jgi:predicted DCC family thiol-disulfide oxidoreductase YuxK
MVRPPTSSGAPDLAGHSGQQIESTGRPLLLYDADCRFCRWAARVIAQLDRDEELAFLPLRVPEANSFLEPLPPEERYASWWLISPAGTRVGHGQGARDLLLATRLTRPLGRALSLVPDVVLDACYRFVASRRALLGRLVPDRPGPNRFP